MSFIEIRRQLLELNEHFYEPATSEGLDKFERHYDVRLPADVRANYLLMNGSEGYTNPHKSWMRFWPIDGWRLVRQELSGPVAQSCSASSFLCADYAIDCVFYCIDLEENAPTYGHVYALGQTRAGLVASSFDDFVMKVIVNDYALHNYS